MRVCACLCEVYLCVYVYLCKVCMPLSDIDSQAHKYVCVYLCKVCMPLSDIDSQAHKLVFLCVCIYARFACH